VGVCARNSSQSTHSHSMSDESHPLYSVELINAPEDPGASDFEEYTKTRT
jgi:hypothetical protein